MRRIVALYLLRLLQNSGEAILGHFIGIASIDNATICQYRLLYTRYFYWSFGQNVYLMRPNNIKALRTHSAPLKTYFTFKRFALLLYRYKNFQSETYITKSK